MLQRSFLNIFKFFTLLISAFTGAGHSLEIALAGLVSKHSFAPVGVIALTKTLLRVWEQLETRALGSEYNC